MRRLPDPFWQHADVTGGPDSCWPWQRSRIGAGYGVFRGKYAHRLSFEHANGPIPAGLLVCHHCDNPPCINPRHLYLGTNRQNIRDASRRGLLRRGELHHATKLTADDVRSVFALRQEGWTQKAIADRFDVTREAIRDILHGRNWKHISERVVDPEPVQMALAGFR